MSDNPLDDSDGAREEKIRERAYHLWQADGEPHGHDAEYWERARELVGMEERAGFGQLPNPATVPGADPSRREPVEEAFIQENLGEFPGQMTDQGEDAQAPDAGLSHEGSEPASVPAAKAPRRKPAVKADSPAAREELAETKAEPEAAKPPTKAAAKAKASAKPKT